MNFKKIGCWLLALTMVLTLSTPINAYAASKFSDTSGHWAENYINTAVNQGIIKGYPNGTFLPDKAVSRAEFSTMVNKALGNAGTATLSFVDVSYGEWYYSDISKAVAAAYAGGYNDNTFKPNDPITRQEAAVMISRFVPTYGKSGNLSAYSDSSSIADWAYSAMQKVNGKGYIGAYNDNRIHPADQLTRAQTAKIICDITSNENIVSSDPVVKENGSKLSGKIYSNNVTVSKSLGDNSATIENCVILGSLNVQGGGVNTVTIDSSRVVNASVDKADSAVRVLAKNESSIENITASGTSTIQTSSLDGGFFGSGFNKINVNGSANLTLNGSFPIVNVNGSSATVKLESGSITDLEIGSSAKNSNITAASGSTISKATVNAVSFFHGTGTISTMLANVSGITYETKPSRLTVSSGVSDPSYTNAALEVTFSPKNTATNVNLDSQITITFPTAIKMSDGDAVTESDIKKFIDIRKDSESGSTISYSASINSSKKIITLVPSSNLNANTKYYVTIDKNSVKDTDNLSNTAQSIYFKTGSGINSITTTYSPASGATSVSSNSTITITFSDAVVRYSNGATISSNDSYLKDCIVFKYTNSSGNDVSYSATISSGKKTITITPNSNLSSTDQKYYVAINSNKLKNSSGVSVPSSSATFTTGYTAPILNNFTASAGSTSLSASMTPNVSGKVYLVALASGSPAPSAGQIAAGQNNSGAAALAYAKNESVVAGNSVSLTLSNSFPSGVTYDVWGTLYSTASGTYSTPVRSTATTTLENAKLSSLSVKPVLNGSEGGEQISFNAGTLSYTVNLNPSVTAVNVAASGGSEITINGTKGSSASIAVSGTTTIDVVVNESGKASSTYKITVSKQEDASLDSLKIDGSTQSGSGGSYTYNLSTSGAADLSLSITAKSPYSSISAPSGSEVSLTENSNILGSASYSMHINEVVSSSPKVTFKVTCGSSVQDYTITFVKPAPPVVEKPPVETPPVAPTPVDPPPVDPALVPPVSGGTI